MEEKKAIDNLDERLRAELLREEERMIKIIEADESLKKYHVTEEMDRRMAERLRKVKEERAAYENLSEADKEAIRIGREVLALQGPEVEEEEAPVPITKKKKKRKVFLLVAVAAVLLLAFGMTSIGGVPFIMELMDDKLGNREMTRVDSEREGSEEVLGEISEEAKFYQEVYDTLGVDIVRLGYLPEDTCFLEGCIQVENDNAYVLYEYEGRIIEYQLVLNYTPQVYGHDVEDILLEEKVIDISGVPLTKKTYRLPKGDIQYAVEFEYQNTFYTLNGSISETEFEKMIKNLIFF